MKTFRLSDEHVALLRAAVVSWEDCEFGAPSIDCKRPYGNSNVLADMHEILTGEAINVDEMEPVQEARYRHLHKETQTALQIILAVGVFAPGRYEASDYGTDWRLVSA